MPDDVRRTRKPAPQKGDRAARPADRKVSGSPEQAKRENRERVERGEQVARGAAARQESK